MIEDGQPACVLEQLVPDATERAERRAPTGEGWYFDDYTPNTERECGEGEAPWQAISYATRFTGFVRGRFHCTEPVFRLTDEGLGAPCSEELACPPVWGAPLACDPSTSRCGFACTDGADCESEGLVAVCAPRFGDGSGVCVRPACL